MRDIYLAESIDEAELLIAKAIHGCRLDTVGEVRSLGMTLARRPRVPFVCQLPTADPAARRGR